MRKLAIIGASYLQVPLIEKAKSMGLETHVFAWKVGDIGEKLADYFYPISIMEKEKILEKCTEIGIDGVCSIASDLAVVTVNYVAEHMGLIGNGEESTFLSTNKHNMRLAFEKRHDPSPRSIMVHKISDIKEELVFPVIVKPLDRSGSRGISKVNSREELRKAIENAENEGFIKEALIEEFVDGREYSVECISYKGKHSMLAVTLKYTTGNPHFIETGHLQPAPIDKELNDKIRSVIFHALDTLKISYGASHSEIKIDDNNRITLIEIGARMGGDHIGSILVRNSTGIDYVKAVVDIALGNKPDLSKTEEKSSVGIHYICNRQDLEVYKIVKEEHPEYIINEDVPDDIKGEVLDSSSRFGYFIIKAGKRGQIEKYMPDEI